MLFLQTFNDGRTTFALFLAECDTSRLEYDPAKGTVLNPDRPRDFELRVYEIVDSTPVGLSGRFDTAREVEWHYGVDLVDQGNEPVIAERDGREFYLVPHYAGFITVEDGQLWYGPANDDGTPGEFEEFGLGPVREQLDLFLYCP